MGSSSFDMIESFDILLEAGRMLENIYVERSTTEFLFVKIQPFLIAIKSINCNKNASEDWAAEFRLPWRPVKD